jgi:hypothetical protein
LRAHYNLAGLYLADHRLTEAFAEIRAGLAVAQERGDRSWDLALRSQGLIPDAWLGRWDDAMRHGLSLLENGDLIDVAITTVGVSLVASARGDDAILERCRAAAERLRTAENVDVRGSALLGLSIHALASGDTAAAAELAGQMAGIVLSGEVLAESYRVRIAAALASGDEHAMEVLASWAEALPPARQLPLFRAGRNRLRAELAHVRGDVEQTRELEREAEEILRGLGTWPLLVDALLDRVRRHGDELALSEARQILEGLEATRWLADLPSRTVSAT